MSETYEEVMRRNEPKNYTVRWYLVDGKTNDAYHFETLESAQMYAEKMRNKKYVERVLVLRSGRHPNANRWLSPRRTQARKQKSATGVMINEDVWRIPVGYVDGDADKHGPVVIPSNDNRAPTRSDAEKVEWARNNKFDDRTCLWM